MATFLLWIGAYNIFGSLLLGLCLHQGTADLVLRRWTYMVSEPYVHGAFSRLWMLWAASVNLSLGVVMMFASSWPAEAMRVVILAALFGYLAILVAGLLYQRDPKWGPGLYVGYLLWIGQIGWGLWAVLRS